jgi:hypothetical protein
LVPRFLQTIEDPRSLTGIFRQVIVDQLAKGIKNRTFPDGFAIGRQCVALNVLFHSVAMKTELLGNLSLA